jgi:hypothetical protein
VNGDEEDDESGVQFEENEELIDMFHAVSMKEKSEHHCLKNNCIDKVLSFLILSLETYYFVGDRYLRLSIEVLV